MKSSTHPRILGMAALAFFLAVGARDAKAQSHWTVDLVPRAGVLLPATDAGVVSRLGGAERTDIGRRDMAFAGGASLEVGRRAHPLGGRVSVLNSGATPVAVKHTCVEEAGLCRAAPDEGTASVALIVADLMLEGLEGPWTLGPLTPRLAVGAGVKRSSLDFGAGVGEEVSALALHLGLGAEAGLGPFSAVLEVEDYWSPSGGGDETSVRQRPGSGDPAPAEAGRGARHDVLITLGARLRLF